MMENRKRKWEIETELKDNIDVISVNIYPDLFCGVNLCIKIKDNNKKFFKSRKLSTLLLELNNGDDLHFYIHKAIDKYVHNEYRTIFSKCEAQKAIEEFNEKYSYEKMDVKYE